MKISDKYSQQTIRGVMRLYPNLFQVKLNSLGEFTELYFNDKSISDRGLYIDEYFAGILSLYTEDNGINLKIQTSQQLGELRMEQDFKFPMETSIRLFDMSITISYRLYNEHVYYDPSIIRRQYTIKNIIDEP